MLLFDIFYSLSLRALLCLFFGVCCLPKLVFIVKAAKC